MQERVQTDRELTEGGAQYVEDGGVSKPRLEVTAEQVEGAREEMNQVFDMNSLAERMKELAVRAANAEVEAAEAAKKAEVIRKMISDHQLRQGIPGVTGDQVFTMPEGVGVKIGLGVHGENTIADRVPGESIRHEGPHNQVFTQPSKSVPIELDLNR